MSKPHSSEPTSKIRLLPSESIEEDPENERKTFSNLDELVNSIEQIGVVEPITVHEVDGRYRIITGHRRFRATRALNKSDVQAVVVQNGDGKLRLRSLASNIQRESLHPLDAARALALTLESGIVKSQQELAQAIGKDATWVSGVLKIAKLDPELQSELQNIPNPPPYDAVIRVARLKNKEQQRALLTQLKSGATVKYIRAALKQDKTKPPAQHWEARSPHGYTATVTGPQNDPERMLEAISLLVRKIRADLRPEA